LQPKAPQSPVDPSPADVPLDEIKRRALSRPAPRCGSEALRCGRVTVIAEIDPARTDRASLAEQYARRGVGALAAPAGDPACAADIGAYADVPVLSLEPATASYQIWLARAQGADFVLVPAAALADVALVALVERAESIGMTAVVEVRDGRDLVRALRAGARVVLLRPPVGASAAQARAALHDLLAMCPDGVVRVAECGPAGQADLISFARLGADAVLLGTALLDGADPWATAGRLASMGAHPALSRSR
jgi:indole-3-glycerol phosphate synthase